MIRECSILTCTNTHYGRGWCKVHYLRWYQTGSSLTPIKKESHGQSKTPEYNIWLHIKDRCYNQNSRAYSRYGGRGIRMNDLWYGSFNSFFEYIGKKPIGMTLDRINNNGNYEPGNIRWATKKTQSYNRRRFESNTSGYTGVSFDKEANKWRAKIGNMKVGRYKSKEEAAIAYDIAAIQLYDDEAHLNVVGQEISEPTTRIEVLPETA